MKDGVFEMKASAEMMQMFSEFKDEPFMENLKNEEKCAEMAEKLSKYGFVLVYYRKGQIAGFISGYSNNLETRTAFVTLLVIKQAVKGLLRAKILYELGKAVCVHSLECGMTTVELEVAKDNVHAQQVYERAGWRKSGKETERTYFMSVDPQKVLDKLGGWRPVTVNKED